MGRPFPHPYGRRRTTKVLPYEAGLEDARWQCLVCDTRESTLASTYRVALVPCWASWWFEVLLPPRMRVSHMPDLQSDHRVDLAQVLKELASRYQSFAVLRFAAASIYPPVLARWLVMGRIWQIQKACKSSSSPGGLPLLRVHSTTRATGI